MQTGDWGTTTLLLFPSSPGKGPGAVGQAGSPTHPPFPRGDSAEAPGTFPPHVTLAHLHPCGAAPREGNRKQTKRLLGHKPRGRRKYPPRHRQHGKANPFLPSQKNPPSPFGEHCRKGRGLHGTAGAARAARRGQGCAPA